LCAHGALHRSRVTHACRTASLSTPLYAKPHPSYRLCLLGAARPLGRGAGGCALLGRRRARRRGALHPQALVARGGRAVGQPLRVLLVDVIAAQTAHRMHRSLGSTTLPPLLAAPFEACILRSGVVTAVLLNAICASPYADRLDQPPPQTTHSNIGIAVRFVQHPVAYSKSLCIIL